MSPSTFWPINPGVLVPFLRPAGKKVLITPVEDGPPSSRLRSLGNPGRIEGELCLDGADYDLFWTWGEDLLVSWSTVFYWRDPATGAVRRMLFAGEPSRRNVASMGGGMDPGAGAWRLGVVIWILE